ncbi:hypothetical protein ACHAWX_007298 [Stephanocyclus meneghinianus]
MRISIAILFLVLTGSELSSARSSGRPSSSSPRRSTATGGKNGRNTNGHSARPRPPADEFDDVLSDDDGDDAEMDAYDDYEEEEEEEDVRPPPRRRPPPRSSSAAPRRPRSDEDYSDEDYRPPSRRSSRQTPPRSRRDDRVVAYRSQRRGPPPPPVPSAFTRGLSAIRDRIPDPDVVKQTVLTATKAAQETTTKLSSNIYREVKGLTSSELEQVMLKATRPDDVPVKSKHVERLVGVTYQISGKYDIYDAVLRKLWNKMAEKDVRTKLKSVYVLHRFSVDGGPDHREALKQRLRALRKTKDPKRSGTGGKGGAGTRYFDSKVLIGTDTDPDTQGYRAFLSRYAHYVLTRAQTFGGVFNEISLAQMPPSSPPSKKSRSKSSSKSSASVAAANNKPKNPPLCEEHLKFAQMVLKAGLACTLHDGEECESTAMCVERVAADLMGLTAAVAVALKRELKQPSEIEDESLVKQWCQFYSEELLPDTKKFVKKTSSKLDVYGLYLPSRMSASLPQELLERGLKLGDGEAEKDEDGDEEQPSQADVEEESKGETLKDEAESKSDAERGDVSLAMSSNKNDGVSSQVGEDEYDEYYDEYDEEDEE